MKLRGIVQDFYDNNSGLVSSTLIEKQKITSCTQGVLFSLILLMSDFLGVLGRLYRKICT